MVIDIVARESAGHLVHIVRRARERHRIAVARLHERVQAGEILHRGVKAGEIFARAVHERLLAENDVPVAVVRDLVALGEHAADEAVVVLRAALLVAVNVRVMVKAHAAPRGAAELAGLVGVVGARVADDVEAAARAVLRQRVEQHVRERPAIEPVRRRGQAHRPVVKRHGADAPRRVHALDAPGIADIVFFCGHDELLDDLFALLSYFNDPGHDRSPLSK